MIFSVGGHFGEEVWWKSKDLGCRPCSYGRGCVCVSLATNSENVRERKEPLPVNILLVIVFHCM